MTDDQYRIRVHEVLHRKGDDITAAEYVYDEIHGNVPKRQHRVIIKREEFERIAATIKKSTIPFESFTKVTRPLLMGHFASAAGSLSPQEPRGARGPRARPAPRTEP